MGTRYHITCVNSTDKTYFFGVYQDFPDSPGLQSIAWQVRGVPPKGSSPSTSSIDWTIQYGVSVANWDANGKSYTGQQIVDAELGFSYRVYLTQGEVPTIDPIPTGTTADGQIKFLNDTNKALDLGFTLDGRLIAVQNVSGGETINYVVHPTYYVACYRDIKQGQFVDTGVQLGPVTVAYGNGYAKCEVEAAVDGGRYILKDPVYVSTFKAFANPELDAAGQASTVAVRQQKK